MECRGRGDYTDMCWFQERGSVEFLARGDEILAGAEKLLFMFCLSGISAILET